MSDAHEQGRKNIENGVSFALAKNDAQLYELRGVAPNYSSIFNFLYYEWLQSSLQIYFSRAQAASKLVLTRGILDATLQFLPWSSILESGSL